jgi:hypothetical protein
MRDRLLRSSTTTTCKQGHRVKAPSRGRADRQASANLGLGKTARSAGGAGRSWRAGGETSSRRESGASAEWERLAGAA